LVLPKKYGGYVPVVTLSIRQSIEEHQ